jgi:hypothetical protein
MPLKSTALFCVFIQTFALSIAFTLQKGGGKFGINPTLRFRLSAMSRFKLDGVEPRRKGFTFALSESKNNIPNGITEEVKEELEVINTEVLNFQEYNDDVIAE